MKFIKNIYLLPALIFPFMLYGQTSNSWFEFTADGKECIVKRSDLPLPWLNRLSNDVFFTWITHNGYIESFLLDPHLNGLTNPQETSGRFYVRDNETGAFFLVNEKEGNENWSCHVGLGYNRITSQVHEIEAQVTYFIPRDEDAVIMLVEISNPSNRRRNIDVFGQVEWNLGDAVKSIIYRGDGRGGSQFNLYKKAYMEDNILYAQQQTWKSTGSCNAWPYTGYFTVNEPVKSHETIREKFLGDGRDPLNPEMVINGKCSNTDFWSEAEYPWGVLNNSFTLEPGGQKTLVFTLGMVRDKDNAKTVASKYSSAAAAHEAFANVKKRFDDLIDNSINVSTPDKENDRLLNIWTKYMWRQFYKKSLNNGMYGLGLWTYGIEGEQIRANAEQVMLPFDMELIKNSVLNHLKNQNPDTTQTDLTVGTHSMLYEDLGLTGPPESARGNFNVPHHHQIYGFFFPVYHYLLETGDLSFLDRKLPYINGQEATVLNHLQTAFTIATKGLNDRGLPRIPTNVGDWMDEFTKISVNDNAESVMLGGQLCYLLKGFSDIVKEENPDVAAKWMAIYEKIRKGINDVAWDGNWYIRAFSDRSNPPAPVGSNANEEGKIYLNAQSWMILSGIATPERAEKSLEAVKTHLVSDYGPMIFYPPYSRFVDYVGTQSLYSPGFRNACIYLRPAGWAIMAVALSDQPELAYDMYSKASLNARARDIGNYRCEPYAYPENYNGPFHRLKGQGEFQWNFGEGTAWMWYSYVNYILGIRPQITGLLIDPKIPAQWDGYQVSRPFRGSVYHIEVKNPNHKSSGIKSVAIDGKKIKGNLVPEMEAGKEYNVTVIM